jgi:ABC-type glutathione transport system ATPase component
VDLAPAGYDEPTRAGAELEAATAGSSAPPVLECRNVWKVFGPKPQRIVGSAMADLPRAELARVGNVAAVRDISFSVVSGELFVVMGLSGSGKSTLVRCLSRLIEPTAGEVLMDGEDVTAASPERLRELRRTKMSMVFSTSACSPPPLSTTWPSASRCRARTSQPARGPGRCWSWSASAASATPTPTS